MEILSYDENAGYQWRVCQCCGLKRLCCQHHIDRRKNTDRVIWVCTNKEDMVIYIDPCHMKIHNPVAFGLPSSWAYDNGYMVRLDSAYRPKKGKENKWKLKKGIGLAMNSKYS